MSDERALNPLLSTPPVDPEETKVRNDRAADEKETETTRCPRGVICCRGTYTTGEELTRVVGRVYNRIDNPTIIDPSGQPIADPSPDGDAVEGNISRLASQGDESRSVFSFAFETSYGNNIKWARSEPSPTGYNLQQIFLWAELNGDGNLFLFHNHRVKGVNSTMTECDEEKS